MKMAAFFAAATLLFAGCGEDGEDGKDGPGDTTAPTIVLVGGDIDAVHEITPAMSVKVTIAAPGGIADFGITIDSPCLTQEALEAMNLATSMNLVAPATEQMGAALVGLGFPVGAEVKDAKELTFDISTLIPMIALIYDKTSDHKFALNITDAAGQKVSKTLKFHLTAPPVAITYNNDANLWMNTATVTTGKMPVGAKVQYRVKDAADWIDATLVEGTTYRFAPVWAASKNDAQLDIHTIQAGTGIFAGTTYECRVADGDQMVGSSEFTTAAGDKIPNGDMAGWSKKQMAIGGNSYSITYPNPEGLNFWDSGNNMFLENENPENPVATPLCFGENGSACLMPRMVMGFVFAPGNMFSGQFNYAGMSGTASFGQSYVWTARPRAIKVRYKATVGLIDKVGSNDPEGESYQGKQDRSCIFVAVVNWRAQHGVTSGMVEPSGMWNPAESASFDEGPILGYGQQIITENKEDWYELTIPMSWYDKEAANPSSANFSLVISTATSVRGDYLTGCSTNKMYVDDFEWVY